MNINKIVRIGRVRMGQYLSSVFCKISYLDGRFSVSGVVGPKSNGDCVGGCGQIDMSFGHRNHEHNDKRNLYTLSDGTVHDSTIYARDIKFAPGWSAELWFDLLDVWHEWHLNDMQTACEHQRALGWTYDGNWKTRTVVLTPAGKVPGNVVTYTRAGECPVCGYVIGTAWLSKEVPQSVLEFVMSLPDTDEQPAWV